MSSIFPKQDIPEKDKNDGWKRQHLLYAEHLFTYNNRNRDFMNRMFMSYNGIKPSDSLNWLVKRYGARDKASYVTYRLGRTKIDLLHGERLKRPLTATITTINSEAMSEKMRQQDQMMGAMIARKELMELKDKAGVDVMEGVQIPESEDDPVWKKMSFKDKAEDMMQLILDNQIKDLDAKYKLGEDFKNCTITNRAFCQVERNESGDVELHSIDPRRAIYEALEGDDYLEKSPILGCVKEMSIHSVLMRYKLTDEQRAKLDEARNNPYLYVGASGLGRGYMREDRGELWVDVLHIVWKSVTPTYTKIVKKTASQLMFDDSEDTLRLPMDTEKYEKNKDYHDEQVKNGAYEIETKWDEEEYEATRIGGIIDVNMRKTYFKKYSVDKPSHILSSSYLGYIHGRTDGITVPLQQVIENFDNIYDITMYQILKDLVRAKGRVIAFDRASLGKKQKIEHVMHALVNDGLYDYDSAQAGNLGTRLDPANILKTVDLGLSDTFQYLITLRNDIRNELNQITGINENRMGITAASSTATAQQSDISNSRTITEALFYGFSGYTKRVFQAIVNASSVSWAFYKLEKGEQILGSDKFNFLQITKDIGYRDYGVHIEDGSAYMEISQKIQSVMEMAINAKTIDTMDVMNVLLADTLAQKKAFLREAMERMQQIAQQQQEANNQAQAKMQQQQQQTQLQMATETREDDQQNQKDLVILGGQVQMEVDDNNNKAKMYQQNLKSQAEIIKATDATI